MEVAHMLDHVFLGVFWIPDVFSALANREDLQVALVEGVLSGIALAPTDRDRSVLKTRRLFSGQRFAWLDTIPLRHNMRNEPSEGECLFANEASRQSASL